MDKLRKIIIIYILVATVIFLAAIFIPRIIESSKKLPRATIENANIIEDTPAPIISDLETRIYAQIEIDTGKKINKGVIIRNEPHYENVTNGEVEEIFYIDIDEIQQSYMVYYRYNKSNEVMKEGEETEAVHDIILFCLTNEQNIKYSNSHCNNSQLPKEDELYRYLSPKTFTLKNGKEVKASFQQNRVISLQYESCEKTNLSGEAKTAIREWLKSYGLSDADFTFSYINEQTNCVVR